MSLGEDGIHILALYKNTYFVGGYKGIRKGWHSCGYRYKYLTRSADMDVSVQRDGKL